MNQRKVALLVSVIAIASLGVSQVSLAQTVPPVRGGAPGAGGPLIDLTPDQRHAFDVGLEEFSEEEVVADGLGPRFNLNSCLACHSQPAPGGTSPASNPQVGVNAPNDPTEVAALLVLRANIGGVSTQVFSPTGPVREVRFKFKSDGVTPDGGVHNTATITGMEGAGNCALDLPNFQAEAAKNNLSFRIPTPIFGAGLIEQILDRTILANVKPAPGILGITGRPNRNGNDGTISRFGWKAQNKSLLLFAGEAYNVEMGITNELFQTEREESDGCRVVTPNDVTDTKGGGRVPDNISAIENFAFFMRFLAPPTPAIPPKVDALSVGRGRLAFTNIGCHLCHTPTLMTGPSPIAALDNRPVNLYSDLLLHNMGPGLADGISQGQAGPRDFRTAPLWGLGQRIFYLHDGRTTDLIAAIQAHRSGTGANASEANAVIAAYDLLPAVTPQPPAVQTPSKQDLLNFLRSL